MIDQAYQTLELERKKKLRHIPFWNYSKTPQLDFMSTNIENIKYINLPVFQETV